MSLSRERLVETVLDSVNNATQAQLRRGPRVDFGADEGDGEIGDDQVCPSAIESTPNERGQTCACLAQRMWPDS